MRISENLTARLKKVEIYNVILTDGRYLLGIYIQHAFDQEQQVFYLLRAETSVSHIQSFHLGK